MVNRTTPQPQDPDREAARRRQPEGGMSLHDAQGKLWKKMDLHLHTPASSDYRDPGISYLDILKKAEEKGLDMIAFADHNTVGGYSAMHREIETLTLLEKLDRLREEERSTLAEYRRLLSKIVVLPAFEFTATFGFHILGIFPEDTSVRKLEYLLLDLNVPEDKMVAGAPDVGYSSDVLRAYQVISAAGGLAIAAHANSSNGVAMQGFPLGGQTKIAYTQDPNLTALEVTDLEAGGRRTTPSFFNGSKPEYPRRMHCIQGSDAHSLDTEQSDSANKRLGVGARVTEILVKETSFNALKEILTSTDFTRIRPYRGASAWDFAERARSEGPNIIQSFHERALSKTSRTRPVLHDIVAFANTNGGTIYVGVNPNVNVAVHGVDRPDEDVRLLKSDLQHSIEPSLDVKFDVKQSGNRAVILITVPKGQETPYAYTPTGQIFVREEDETAIASRDEIIDLVRKSLGDVTPSKSRTVDRPRRAAMPVVEEIPTTIAPHPQAAQAPKVEAKATPVPTVPQQDSSTIDDRRWTMDEKASASIVPPPASASASASASANTDTRRLWESEPASSSAPERAYRSPALANLPPEKIKGKVQPMLPRGLPAPKEEQPEREAQTVAEQVSPEQITSLLSTVQLEQYAENVVPTPTAQSAESAGRATRSRRGRGRVAEAREVIEEPPAAQAAQGPGVTETAPSPPTGKRSRGRKRTPDTQVVAEASPLQELPAMEATVASEHETREENVAEAASSKPRRGRRRSGATQQEQQLEIDAPTAAAAATFAGEQAILTEAEIEPGAQIPSELPSGDISPETTTGKSRSRRKRGGKEQVEAAPLQVMESGAASAVAPVEQETANGKKPRRSRKKSAGAENETPVASEAVPSDPPSTGVEIISTETRNGINYHTMRDLRNHSTVHNVTRHSARRLWHYAIMQHEHGDPAMSEVAWHSDQAIGIWRRGQRAGDMRYDLVARKPDGTFEVYYGVTEEGLHGLWSELVIMAEQADYWGPEAFQ